MNKINFICIDGNYKTNITLKQFAKSFSVFEDMLTNGVLSNEVLSNEVFEFECNLTKKYLKIIINLLFMNESLLTDKKINWFKIIYFFQKNGYKDYELFMHAFLLIHGMEDYQYVCLCEIRTFDETYNAVFYDNIFLFKVYKIISNNNCTRSALMIKDCEMNVDIKISNFEKYKDLFEIIEFKPIGNSHDW